MGARDVDVLIRLGDSMRNSAMGMRITLPNIGGLSEIRGPRGNSSLGPMETLPRIGGLNRIRWPRAQSRFESAGNAVQLTRP